MKLRPSCFRDQARGWFRRSELPGIRHVRRFFDGIAARIGGTVVAALILTVAVTGVLFLFENSITDPPVHSLYEWGQRISTIVAFVETTPPERRPAVTRALDDSLIHLRWSPDRPKFDDDNGFPASVVRRQMRRAVGDRTVLIAMSGARQKAGWRHDSGPPDPDDPPPALGSAEILRRTQVRVAVQLADGSWLQFSSGDPAQSYLRLLVRLGWLAAVAVIVLLLSVTMARRLARPIDSFAEAATRLGVDPDAPPLDETGPRELRMAIRAFNGMQERLKRFIADRTQMLGAISHDLRTPLTRLRLRAELVDDPEMQRKMLSDLNEMEGMIRASLEFARDDAKREPRGPLDLADLLQSLCDDRVDSGHEAEYEGPPHFRIDGRPVALRRAFANIMDNAIAYGQRVRCRLMPEPATVRLDFEDDGPGIPESEREKVFAPFYRIEHSRSRDTGGVGLGLSTARSVLRGHGGDIALDNRAEGGLRVTVTLPR